MKTFENLYLISGTFAINKTYNLIMMLKKAAKIIGIIVLLLLITLFAIPYFFKDEIEAKIVEAINEKVDAKVSFEEADLSLFKNFPKASISIHDLLIINKAPFEGDTLISLGELNLKMSIKELFKSANEPMNIEAFSTENGLLNIIFNKDGIGNFDIALKEAQQQKEENSQPLILKIESYKIENLKFKYFDEASKIKLELDSLNHTGTGNFADTKLDLVTNSTAKISLSMDKTNYLNHVALTLEAVLGIDLEQSKYTFKENKALINQLPLEFDGLIQLVEKGQEYDLKFKTPTSSFQNFLGLIPEAYSGNIKDVKTTGDFTVAGFAKGLYSDETIPKFNIKIASNNASFQYPDLPKSVRNIKIDTEIINESGVLNDTYVNLKNLSFQIDQDIFNAKANIKNISQNPLIDAKLNGIINLENVSKAYPVKSTIPLSGILKADVSTKFDMQSVEKNEYEKMQNSGSLTLTGFKYVDDAKKVMNINKADLVFTNTTINLKELDLTTGKTDMKINGILQNFYGFIFKNQVLKGNFNMQSHQFAVSDFMSSETPKSNNKPKEEVKIPAFLDCTITAKANTVLYDNLTLKDVSGKIIIYDQKATLENVKSSIFKGQIGLNGSVSTKEKTPTFKMYLDMNSVDIEQTFTQLDMMKKLAPIAGVINGKINSKINVSGNLDPIEMTPNLNSISGNLNSQLLSTTINESNSELLKKLGEYIKFIDFDKINLNDLKTALTFENGKVNVKPFDIKYQDIKATIGGQHGFDQSLKYDVKFDVPVKYLGTDVNKLVTKLTPAEATKIEAIPINAIITGDFKNPKISTDMKSAITNLTNQLINQQKDNLIKQGTSALEKIINKNTKKDSTVTKSTSQDVEDKATELIDGLFKKKKK